MVREVLRERFIETLTKLGGSAGNGRLRETIGWQDDTYWSVHAALIEDGTIIAGRGRGGSVALAARPKTANLPPAKPAPQPDLLAPTAVPAAAPKPAPKRAANNGATLGFEAQLFQAADKLRKNLEPSDYKHVALGLIFLKHISLAFEAKRAALLAEDPTAAEDPDEYLAENVFWVPKEARWSHLQASARQTAIGKIIDDAMGAIEAHNTGLKGVLPKDYNRPALDKVMLGELIDLISGIATGEPGGAAKDLLGRVYEYFLGGFAGSEGKRGGEFYTPRSVVRVLVEMLEPYKGRVYDPCCGSGGMFVQSEKFVTEHGGRIGDIAIYGQESNYTTWRLAKMNLAVRGIDADIRWNNEGSFHKDELKDLRFDHILANPPFNISDWGGERLREDARWVFGAPPAANANYGWLQHIWWHLAPGGTAGVVLANGSMSSGQSGEDVIRRAMVEADAVDCMVALPGQLFYSTQIPACLWFLARGKNPGGGWRDRRGEVLFIDARKMGALVDRTRRELSQDDIARIADTYHAWRGETDAGAYADVPGFCKAATLEEIRAHNHVLTPGRYVGAADAEDDGLPFAERFAALRETLDGMFAKGRMQDEHISDVLSRISADA
jgi:type I restriction enzyme M protein